MSHDEFTRLFKYVSGEFDSLHKLIDLTATKEEFNRVMNAVDAYAKQTETYMQEMLVLGNKVDRSEQWILKIADATHVKLVA